MNPTTKTRLTNLNARVAAKVVEFRAQDEEGHKLRNTAIGAGVAGAGYGAAALYRGRKWQKDVTGAADNSVSGLVGALKTGHQMNKMAAAGVASKVGETATKMGRNAKAALIRAQRRLTPPLLKK